MHDQIRHLSGIAWTAKARFAQRLARRRSGPRERWIRQYVPGRSFVDIGAMWSVDGEIAFLAEEAGAAAVTALDVMEPTARYAQEHQRRSSAVRFVRGDIHDPATATEVGPHQVVWCSGVLYHAPSPMLTLARLREITRERLILATETIPEVPGLAQACVFFPGLADTDRRVHAFARPQGVALGIDTPFEPDQGYGAWWWGISRSALRGMLRASGFEIESEHGGPLHVTVIAVPHPRHARPAQG